MEAVNRKKLIYLPRKRIMNYVKGELKRIADVLIMMGAGDIYSLVDPLRKL